MKYQQWSIPELPAGAVDRLTGAGYPYLVSSVLASRGITTPEEAAAQVVEKTQIYLSE